MEKEYTRKFFPLDIRYKNSLICKILSSVTSEKIIYTHFIHLHLRITLLYKLVSDTRSGRDSLLPPKFNLHRAGNLTNRGSVPVLTGNENTGLGNQLRGGHDTREKPHRRGTTLGLLSKKKKEKEKNSRWSL